jgi:transcriptional regulator with XRE-family HTH domain
MVSLRGWLMSPAANRAPVVAHFGANVRRARVRRGLTQDACAEAAEMSVVHLRRIERGEADVRISILVKVAAALATTPTALLAPSEPVHRPPGRPKRRRRRPPPVE